jgi:hypothetical protein
MSVEDPFLGGAFDEPPLPEDFADFADFPECEGLSDLGVALVLGLSVTPGEDGGRVVGERVGGGLAIAISIDPW